jgi:hypothetical protein
MASKRSSTMIIIAENVACSLSGENLSIAAVISVK